MNLTRTMAVTGAIGTLLLAGCSTDATSGSDTAASGDASSAAALTVGTAFYPLQFVAERVGGDDVTIETLISPGVEPHDSEISPATVRAMQTMDTVLYLSDFQPAIDAAVETTEVRTLDAHHIVDENSEAVAIHAEEAHEGHDHAEDDHEDEDEDAEDHDGHDHGSADPHFWQDPTLLAEYTTDVIAEFSELDPDNAAAYEERGQELITDLNDLDTAFTEGLATCERRDLYVGHEAFGYMALAYDLAQEGLSGIDPEAEPSPARVREVRDLVLETGATTIFTDSEVSASVADSLAEDAGVEVAVLDPLESVVDGDDYLGVMNRNLEALRTGLACS